MDAMFNLDVEESVQAKGVCRLQSDLPLNLFILDLGGGLADRNNKVITEEDIISPPFQPFCGVSAIRRSLGRTGFS